MLDEILLRVKDKPENLTQFLSNINWRLHSRVLDLIKVKNQIFDTGDDIASVEEQVKLDHLPVHHRISKTTQNPCRLLESVFTSSAGWE